MQINSILKYRKIKRNGDHVDDQQEKNKIINQFNNDRPPDDAYIEGQLIVHRNYFDKLSSIVRNNHKNTNIKHRRDGKPTFIFREIFQKNTQYFTAVFHHKPHPFIILEEVVRIPVHLLIVSEASLRLIKKMLLEKKLASCCGQQAQFPPSFMPLQLTDRSLLITQYILLFSNSLGCPVIILIVHY